MTTSWFPRVMAVDKSKPTMTPSGTISARSPQDGTPAGKAVWQQSDFTFLGTFYSMATLSQGYGFTGRRTNNVFTLLDWDENGTLWEYVPPTPSLSKFFNGPPRPSNPTNLGFPPGIYNGFAFQSLDNQASDYKFQGLYWDEVDQRLYWMAVGYYDNDPYSNPTVGYSTWNGSSWTPVGFWALADTRANGGYGNRWTTTMGAIPASFQPYVGGRRLWVGGGGGRYIGIHGNNTCIGPTLFAMNPLAGTEPWKSIAPSANIKPLLFHPYHESPPAPSYPQTSPGQGYLYPPRPARRPTIARPLNKYANINETAPTQGAPDDPWIPDVSATNGYLGPDGDSNPAGVWLETATKYGFISFLTIIEGSFDQPIQAMAYVGQFGGIHFWDVTVPSTSGLAPNMEMYLSDGRSPLYGGWSVVVLHNANTTTYAPNLPEGSTTSPILSSTQFRMAMTQAGSTFVDLTSLIGNRITAGVWYSGGGGRTASYGSYWAVYDPQDLIVQANNTTGPWSELDPKRVWAQPYLQRREQDIYGTDTSGGGPAVVGVAVDDVAKIMYLKVHEGDRGTVFADNLSLVYAFSYT